MSTMPPSPAHPDSSATLAPQPASAAAAPALAAPPAAGSASAAAQAHPVLTPEVLQRLRAAGLRVTPATRAVLGLWAANPGAAPCHFEVLGQLQARGVHVNRVTLYRLLDRLAACGVLQRHADALERRWRFSWAALSTARTQPQFECDACHCLLPLPAAALQAQQLAQALSEGLSALGHQPQRLDLTLHGTCADCLQPKAASAGTTAATATAITTESAPAPAPRT